MIVVDVKVEEVVGVSDEESRELVVEDEIVWGTGDL